MNNHYNKNLKKFAQSNRNQGTKAEVRLWCELLRNKQMLGFSFLRQRPIDKYIADFYCKDLKLIIEVDGYSHGFEEIYFKDVEREKRLIELGFSILRFKDSEVMNEIYNVGMTIENWINENREKIIPLPPSKEDMAWTEFSDKFENSFNLLPIKNPKIIPLPPSKGVVAPTDNLQILKAVQLLSDGKVVAIPTETVYGLAANALNEDAVTEIFKIKNRPFFDPLIVHIADKSEVEKYVTNFPEKAQKLAREFWPGPLTLILPKNEIIPDLVTSGLPFVGLRVPNHPLTLELLKKLPFPLAAPSANPFGYVSPTTAKHVEEQLGDKISYILDGGPCEVGLESTIVMFENNETPVILRLGGLSIEAIENCIGKVSLNIASHSKPNSPGQLDKHYATRTPLKLITEIDFNTINVAKTGAITFHSPFVFLPLENQKVLSPAKSTEEAAHNLFAAMRELDSLNFDLILTETFPSTGLGPAINDRLNRAKV